MDGTDGNKQSIREHVWTLLRDGRATSKDPFGRIPHFFGADEAADRLAEHSAWKSAAVVKAVPDGAQTPVRARALEEGKRVYMAASKLAAEKPFYLLAPDKLTISPREAAERHVAAAHALPVDLHEMSPVDLVVCGSVAVNPHGVRMGKGAGYSDIEMALLREAGLMRPSTLIATTVHELQVVEGELPESEHDFRVDLIVTPERIIECAPHPRPRGIIWESLPPDKISAIPVLRNRRSQPDNHFG